MRKVKEVLRLRFALGLQQNQIARSCAIGQATVHRYLQKASAAGLTWPLPENLDDRRLEELLFPAAVGRPNQITRSLPDFAEIRRQLQTHKHLTLQLVWEEYRETQPDGYAYSRFCELYDRWSRNPAVSFIRSPPSVCPDAALPVGLVRQECREEPGGTGASADLPDQAAAGRRLAARVTAHAQ